MAVAKHFAFNEQDSGKCIHDRRPFISVCRAFLKGSALWRQQMDLQLMLSVTIHDWKICIT